MGQYFNWITSGRQTKIIQQKLSNRKYISLKKKNYKYSKSFSICPTILSKRHLLWTVLWKHKEKTRKTFIFLKQPTKEEMWRFNDALKRS